MLALFRATSARVVRHSRSIFLGLAGLGLMMSSAGLLASTSGVISTTNSTLGQNASDQIGSFAVTELPNGNVVIQSPNWNGGFGAVTCLTAAEYQAGGYVISAANSLVGSAAGHNVGGSTLVVLSNGNYVVRSGGWDDGATAGVGAVTWVNGSNCHPFGASGRGAVVSAANSMVGTTASDAVGTITALTNGNYVVRAANWDNGAVSNAGMVRWCDGSTGNCVGPITSSNAAVGSTASDQIGTPILALANGNYVFGGQNWDNGAATDAGFVRLCSGTTGCTGTISSGNSMVGTASSDQVGSSTSFVELSTGFYVFSSPTWSAYLGAVTRCSISTGCTGTISSANSLVGSTFGDQIGQVGVIGLSNGNYVVSSPGWNGTRGAVTLCNGASGCTGTVTSANSLVGTAANHLVGWGGVVEVRNGSYVALNYEWDGVANGVGAATFCPSTGCTGAVSAANSLTGTTLDDKVGQNSIAVGPGDFYAVRTSSWDRGATVDAGAITFCNHTTNSCANQTVSASNSVVGATASEGLNALTFSTSGLALVRSGNWDNGAATDAGAIRFCTAGACTGELTTANSLVGSISNDRVGGSTITLLDNGNFVIRAPNWDNGAVVDAGFVRVCDAASGCAAGTISSANALVGTTNADNVGFGQVIANGNNYLLRHNNWNGTRGALTLCNGSTIGDCVGPVSSSNSVVGNIANDLVGSGPALALSNGNFLAVSPSWDNGANTNAGAVTYMTATSPPTVTSPTSSAVTANSATLGGNVTADGGESISVHGVVLSVTATNNNPQLGGLGVTNLTTTGTTGVFTLNASGLTPNTAYSYKAYATSAAGTGYSSTGTFTTAALPSLTINDVSQTEGNSGTTSFVFTVSLSAPAGAGGVAFDIATANGSATSGSDYVATSLTSQTIPAGSSTYIFTVLVNGDTANEPAETYFVNVTNVTNASVSDGQGVGTITNDDPLPSLSINDVIVTEGNSGTASAAFTVALSAASGQTVSVNYATIDGTATQPGDYTNTSGTLTFIAGQTTRSITVPVIGETVPEANETFFVNLSGATNATISDNQGVGTISNDDVPVTVNPATLPNGTVASAYSQTITASGGAGPYTFALTGGALPAGVTLVGGLVSGTPTAGGNFTFTISATDSSGAPGPFTGSQTYSISMAPPTITLPGAALAGGTLGQAYSASITPATGGTAPRTYAVTAGALPGGLTVNPSTGEVTGTPSALGTFNFSITATDSSTGTGPYTATQSYAITIIDVAPVASNSALSVTYNAAATNVPLSLSGGSPTSLTLSTPPTQGTALVSGTTITYQPTAGYAGPDSFSYTASNSGGTSSPATVSVTVQDPVITITPSGGFASTVGAPYTQTFSFNGGASPWSGYQVTNLPSGLSITGTTASSVTISGTPTSAGIFNVSVSATDSSTGNGPYNVGQAFTLTVAAPTLSMTPASGTLNAPYSTAFAQAFAVSGGIGPYTYVLSGTLPAGLTLSGGSISGTPTVPGSFPITITATDTGSSGTGSPFTVAQNYTVDVPAPTITVNPPTLPNPTVASAYSQNLTAAGGASPYSFVVSAGSLPPGITLTTGGSLTGTSNDVGTFNFTVTATDNFGQTGSRAYTLSIAAPILSLTPAPATLNAPYATPFTEAFTAAGGSNTFAYVVTGTLPAGLSFSGNTLSGTPTVPGSYPITITATDTVITGVGAPFSIAQNYTIDVGAPSVIVSPSTLADPTVAQAYSATVSATGGAAPYTFAVTTGSLPPGITLAAGGALSGTSNQVGTYNFTITATDNFAQSGNRPYTLSIAAPTLSMTPAAGSLNAPYATSFSQTFTASGGSGTFAYALTGALPAGLTFSGDTVSGTPTAPGSYPIIVTATDTVITGIGAPFTLAQSYTIDVPAPTIVLSPASLPSGTAGATYTQAMTASGGAAPYTYTRSGALPAGLSFTAGAFAGIPTESGSFPLSITAEDANGQSSVGNYTLVIATPTIAISPASVPNAQGGVVYSQTLTASGGVAPYAFTLTGSLPAGMNLSSTGVISGSPTSFGTFNFSVTATDSTQGTAAQVTQNYTLDAVPTIVIHSASLLPGAIGLPYNGQLSASGGTGPYTYAVTGGTLPSGLSLSTSGAITGTPTGFGSFTVTITATDSQGFTGTSTIVMGISFPATTVPSMNLLGILLLVMMMAGLGASRTRILGG